MKNIHVVPTENPSKLSYNKDGVLELHRLQWRRNTQNIYITNNEEIKEGNWYIDDANQIRKSITSDKQYWAVRQDYKKIILTTDQDLIKDGVQAIDDEFLEFIVKNPSCEIVEVERTVNDYWHKLQLHYEFKYKITIPKEEICSCTNKCIDNTSNICKGVKTTCIQCDGTGETTTSNTYNSQRKCDLCNGRGYWNKEIIPKEELCTCKLGEPYNNACCKVHGSIPKEEPKQETLEDVVVKRINDNVLLELHHSTCYSFAKAGAKWQAERMYSESDKIMKFLNTEKELKLSDAKTIERIIWYFETYFEQFKNK